MDLITITYLNHSISERSRRTRTKEKRKIKTLRIEMIGIEIEIEIEIDGTEIKIGTEIEEGKGLFPDLGMEGVTSPVGEIEVRIARKIEKQKRNGKRKGKRKEL